MLYFLLIFLIALLLFPDLASAGAVNALQICGTAVIPALFPYFLMTRLLAACLPVLPKGPPYLSALMISFLGGYPAGVSAVVSLYENGRLSGTDAQNALRICNNSGPGLFVAIAGGTVLHNAKLGLLLYGIHILSALLCASLWHPSSAKCPVVHRLSEDVSFPRQFQHALSTACTAMLQVCGTVILFSVLLSLLRPLLPHTLLPYVSGCLELTSGVLSLQNHPHAFLLCALFTGWGGLCVHMQAMSLWQSAGLKNKGYFLHKLLHALLSACFAYTVQAHLPLLFAGIVLFFLLFSKIRKKWGRKKTAFAI